MEATENLKILVVDDRPENLLSMQQLLQRPDLDILTAESGNEALGLMLDHDFALVLLDVQMPEMDGFEVASLMRSHESTRHLPIIFVTAINKERRHIFSGYEVGAVDYLFKPVDPFIIRSKVGVFLELKRMEMIRSKLVADLNQANRRLQELSDNKSDFLSAASHELRTPLTVIKENCSLVNDEIVGPLTDDQSTCMDAALRNCNRLADLVNDLLDLDSIESGYGTMSRDEVDAGRLLAVCAGDFRPGCETANQILEIDIEENLPPVLGDEGMITQVIVNLVGNAAKFTPGGGRIMLRAFRSGPGVTIEVEDEGPGIESEDQARIFEKFTQVNRAHGPGPRGTGLGLAISRKIADLLDGSLTLRSTPGEGSTFTFTMPEFDDAGRLEAFVRDATRNFLGVQQDWTLLFFESDEGVPGWMREQVERTIRYGDDRVMEVRVDGRPLLAVMLKTGRDGAVAFLSRLEEMSGRREEAGSLRYVIIDLAQEDQVDFRIAEENLEFLNLNLSVESMGEKSEQGKDPGR